MSFAKTVGAVAGGITGFAVGGPIGAVAGASIGYAGGWLLEKAAGLAKKVLGTPEGKGAAIGAAGGFLLGGPIGAAVGGLAGGLIGHVTKPPAQPPQTYTGGYPGYGYPQAGGYGYPQAGGYGYPQAGGYSGGYGLPPQMMTNTVGGYLGKQGSGIIKYPNGGYWAYSYQNY